MDSLEPARPFSTQWRLPIEKLAHTRPSQEMQRLSRGDREERRLIEQWLAIAIDRQVRQMQVVDPARTSWTLGVRTFARWPNRWRQL